jgi:hypothetical protein
MTYRVDTVATPEGELDVVCGFGPPPSDAVLEAVAEHMKHAPRRLIVPSTAARERFFAEWAELLKRVEGNP